MAEIVCYVYIFHLPDLCHYTTLLKVDVLNFYLTLELLQIAQIWCQSREGILSRQRSCSEATARHAQVVWRRFFMFQQNGTSAHQHATPSLSWSEREMRETRRRLGACVRSRGTFQARILTILSRSVMTTNNFAK